MVRFDRIKIVTDSRNIDFLNSDIATVVYKNGAIHDNRFKQNRPFNFYLNANIVENKSVIETSAKVLGDRYPELINAENISYCLERINRIGICEINIDGVLADSKLISCDVTEDLHNINVPDGLAVKTCLKSLNKFHVKKYSNCGFVVANNVKTQNRKIRLSIYDKYKELHKAVNEDYLAMVDDRYEVLGYFNGRTRIEANIRTVAQIKELLQIDDNNLMDALNSNVNPLLTVFDSIFDIPSNPETTTNGLHSLLSYEKLSDLKNALLVKACDNDIAQIELVLQNYLSPHTNKGKYTAKLKKLINAKPMQNENIRVISEIRKCLVDSGNLPQY